MRLFVAVSPSADALADLADGLAAAQTLDTTGALRWSRPDTWHLTLAFLGEVPDEGLPALRARLERAGRRHAEHEVAFRGAGKFDGRVLWIGLDGARSELRALAQSVQAAARRTGIAGEDRPYRPHLTVARAATPSDLRPYVESLRDYSGPAWPVRSYALIRSQLGQGPGRSALHTVLETWPLTRTTPHG